LNAYVASPTMNWSKFVCHVGKCHQFRHCCNSWFSFMTWKDWLRWFLVHIVISFDLSLQETSATNLSLREFAWLIISIFFPPFVFIMIIIFIPALDSFVTPLPLLGSTVGLQSRSSAIHDGQYFWLFHVFHGNMAWDQHYFQQLLGHIYRYWPSEQNIGTTLSACNLNFLATAAWCLHGSPVGCPS